MSLPNRVPLFPLRTVLFPAMTLPLIIFEPRYRSLVQYCLETRSPFGVVLIDSGDEVATPFGDDPLIRDVGTTARIVKCDELEDGRFLIEARGECRFRIDDLTGGAPYTSAAVTAWPEDDDMIEALVPLMETVCSQLREYLVAVMSADNRQLSNLHLPSDPSDLAYAVASVLDIAVEDKQRLLEAPTTCDRLTMETEILDLLLVLHGVTSAHSQDSDPMPETALPPPESARQRPVPAATITRIDGSAAIKFMSRN